MKLKTFFRFWIHHCDRCGQDKKKAIQQRHVKMPTFHKPIKLCWYDNQLFIKITSSCVTETALSV